MVKLITYLTTFVLIVLAELGDKTQVATLIFASNNAPKRWQVFGAAASALVLCVALEVTIGVTLSRYIGPSTINRLAGVVFLVLGITTLGSALQTTSSHAPIEVARVEQKQPGRLSGNRAVE